uniref:Uncharacterized protein n=1 Tax=Eutreptiella gymnastica TaxID=73025 RepID=A0A7S1I5M7_9EUGL|mmetsp:Transcript_132076/g.228951  ORF Transcript_132076/g.228951 Transcript_132076/m.228951 type:complete len:674 (+) Transcript_132076:124-2145(+)
MDAGKASAEEDTLGQLFMSWIKDTHENPTRENFLRIQEMMDKGCNEKQFVMRSQRLGVHSALTIARLLDRTPIERVDLYENVIRDHGLQALAQLVRDSRSLTYLNVGGNDIGRAGCAYISALLPTNKKLKYLILGSGESNLHLNKINHEAGKQLADALLKNKTVKWLDLNRNPLGVEGQDAFYTFAKLVAQSKTLTTLKLGSAAMGTPAAIAIAGSLKESATLEYLDLHDNDLQPAAAEALAEAIIAKTATGTPSTLQALLLQGNPKLRPKGVIPLFRALREDQALTTLNLAKTSVGNEGALILAETLAVNKTLTHLDLTDNGISEEGAVGLCQALLPNMGVRFLSLSANKIRDEGACALAQTLENNNTLTQLELATTRISDRGTVALGVALAMNSGITCLKMNNNHISDAAGKAFAELIEKNTKALTIALKGNQVSHSTLLQVKKVLKKNKDLKDGDTPNQLQGEVIRLHFQQYKLAEANSQLKEHQKARLELQEQADRTEREAMTENENTAKRSKEIIEKILMVEQYCQEMQMKQKAKEEDMDKGSQQFELDLKALQEKLKADTLAKEEKLAEAESNEAKLKEMELARKKKSEELQSNLEAVLKDKTAWEEKMRIYRGAAQEAQDRIVEMEAVVKEKQALLAQERQLKEAKKKEVKKTKSPDDLIDSLLGA